ncbi:hypothetical protein [Actinoplanes sp. NBRC 101535]|uniref:hypothetical protein n=1 Tax=Actinoplanes sp. NBRC 101535 TaxID=3032196 RepID=UPI00249FE8B6|nr:hypothetical protein [Actinoplanes sp. NBRC 101535]GLY02463.1 hypothetical protein Acsp01_28420 [Actinoplanes sp. NBRC 101535]
MRSIIAGAVVLAGVAALSACAGSPAAPVATSSTAVVPAAPAGTETTVPAGTETTAPAGTGDAAPATTRTATAAGTVEAGGGSSTSDVSQLRKLGIVLDEGVLLDVADDGLDRYLAVGRNGVVDFTGTARTDATMMVLTAAPGAGRNRVVIRPPFYNEDLRAGKCVQDTAGAALTLATCEAAEPAQIWTVEPAGDSGQFELRGKYGILEVDGGKIITGGGGYTGIQTIRFAK